MNRRQSMLVATAIAIAAVAYYWVKRPIDVGSENAPSQTESPTAPTDPKPNVTVPAPTQSNTPSAKTSLSSDADWKGLVDQTWQKIPDFHQAAESRREAGPTYPHSASAPAIRDAGEAIGKMADYIDKNKTNPEAVDAGIEFFMQCALKEEAHLTIRGLCAANARNLAAHVGRPNPWDKEALPESVRNLANQIPAGW